MDGSRDRNEEVHVLHTEPSFAIYSNEEDKIIVGQEVEDDLLIKLERSATIGDTVDSDFSFGRDPMGMIKEDEVDQDQDWIQSNSYHHDAMIRGNPDSPLALRSYAQYLQSIGDFSGAEEYYSRAVTADPEDGETLSQYAAMVWEVHGDRVKASDYFQRAVMAAPDDSNVLAAYASFLWNTDENEDEDEDEDEEESLRLPDAKVHENAVLATHSETDFRQEIKRPSSPPLHLAMGLGMGMASLVGGNGEEIFHEEEHYMRMVEEDPCNPLFLRSYANFLNQVKGDLRGAEEYYSRAILADPGNGQTYAAYAGVLWQLHRDKDRAAAYFEQAIQVAPEDSNVCAAYAKFLWETEAEDDNNTGSIEEVYNRGHPPQGATTATR